MPKKDIQEGLKTLLVLLKKEKEEDLLQYKLKMAGTSLVERRKQGVCWYPVHLERTRFDSGERLLVKVLRPLEHKDPHLFQSGKLVSLFSNAYGGESGGEAVNGVINQVREHDMLITLNIDDIPDWIHDGKLGVQLLFDENSYREMQQTLQFLIKTKDERVNQLKDILLSDRAATFNENAIGAIMGLNESQHDAFKQVVNAQDLAIIHGPPGTGKTTTLVHAIVETLKSENQILVCAPSNAAVDLLAERLGDRDINVLRIGHPARVTEEILGKTLDFRIAHHQEYKNLKSLKKKAEEFFKLGKKYKRSFGASEREQRKLLISEARKLKEEAEHLQFYIINDILSNTQIIATTLVGANNQVLKGMQFKTVFIDEAAQALEPACWIPIVKSQRVIFAGDHCQLPPTIKSQEAAKNGLEVTLFEKAIKHNEADVMLREQYRMHQQIMNFSSRFFYKNQLIANAEVADWSVLPGDEALEFVDTAGCGFFEQIDKESRSSFNQEEADLLIKHFKQYIQKIEASERIGQVENIGIISPYKAQVVVLQEALLETDVIPEDLRAKVNINTVDSFQGQERDIIYISLVRSNENGEIGFLSDTRRMNVAITRARKKLVIIGDSATIGTHPFYEKFLDYIHEIGAYKSAFELMY